jgi:hypothetical protein
MTRTARWTLARCVAAALATAAAGCDVSSSPGPEPSPEPFHAPSVSGTWDVYRTYAGEPERGPDAAAWSNSPDGWGIRMELLCSTYVLPAGHMDLAGEISADREISLADPSVAWTGTMSGDTMAGIFTDPHGSGTWRAQKVAEARCGTYEVWGGSTDLGCGSVAGYNPELYGYTLLGTATTTQTFTGEHAWYYVLTRDRNVVGVDTVETTAGTYLGPRARNVTAYEATAGAGRERLRGRCG